MAMRHGGQILIDQLRTQGVERVFCVPGESYLAALDGLYQSGVDVVIGRQEGGVAMMAEAHGKLTGRPGVAFVTRGPGATNASAGVHIAFQDSTPMILFVGQVASDQRDREAFQEVDYRAMFGPLAKWVAEIDRTDRIPEYVSRAFHVACSGRPGPVVLALPEDMLAAEADIPDAPPARPAIPAPSAAEVDGVLDALRSARNPFLLVGGGGWSKQAAEDLAAFAARFALPVGCSFRCQDYLDNRHPNYVGDVAIAPNPKLAARVRDADVLLVLGPRLGEMTTSGYTLLTSPAPKQRLIHIHADADEIGRVYRPELGVAANSTKMLALLKDAVPPNDIPWRDQTEAARADYEAWREPRETPGDVKMEQVISWLTENLPENAAVTNGAGNYSGFLHRYFQFKTWRTQVGPTSGSMGYGLPAAIAAKLHAPDREVVCLAGDGCFQMTLQELGTAAQYGAGVVVIVIDNRQYGTIRMHQEREYPGRVVGTQIENPDFAALARAYGAYAETIARTEDFPEAFARARADAAARSKPALLHLLTDPAAISPTMRL